MSTSSKADCLVSTHWLATNIAEKKELIVVDASYSVLGGTLLCKEEYKAEHIRDSVFFDINTIADQKAYHSHMMPSKEIFSHAVGKLGISNKHIVIAYDTNSGGCAAARVWWMFKAFGHNNVAVLDGGLNKWKSDGYSVTNNSTTIKSKKFVAMRSAKSSILNKKDIRSNIKTQHYQIIDARSKGRFSGEDKEPTKTLKSGHIPNSINLPYTSLFDKSSQTFKIAEEIKSIFSEKNIDLSSPAAASCGSGVTACNISLASYIVGNQILPIYDGSWVDWASDKDMPIQTNISKKRETKDA